MNHAWREHEGETPLWLRVEPSLGFLRDVRGMISRINLIAVDDG